MANNTQPLRRRPQSIDSNLVKSAYETHNAESRPLNVTPVLYIVENILRIVAPGIDSVIKGTTENVYASDEKVSAASFDDNMLGRLSNVLHRISCEMICKSSVSDAHMSTMAIFKMLSDYPWEAKVVSALASFSVTYGEFWLVAQLCTTSHLAKSVAHLKQVSEVGQKSQLLNPHTDAINKLIAVVLDVTKRIVEFNRLQKECLQTKYLSKDSKQISDAEAHIPDAAYWTIRSIVACAWSVTNLRDIQYEQPGLSDNELWELSGIADMLTNKHNVLENKLESCRKYIAESRYKEEYRIFTNLIESTHQENTKILKALISNRDDKPLFFGTKKRTVGIETLTGMCVLLLISDLNVSIEEILVLQQFYDSHQRPKTHYDRDYMTETPYEIVWIPMIDQVKERIEDHQGKFKDLKAMMPWYVVQNPTAIDPLAVHYIREKWRFDTNTVIVALDSLGKVLSTNAASMMWIWGNTAFPFSHKREEALWNSESWTLKLVSHGIFPDILQRVKEDGFVCLFGSDKIDWIRKFTGKAKFVASTLNIRLELVYVEKSNVPKDRLNKIKAVIETEKMSQYLSNSTSSWLFWSRLDAILRSKAQHKKSVIDTDTILKEVMVLLSYDMSDHGWAAVWDGRSKMARDNGEIFLLVLQEFEKWQSEVEFVGLLEVLKLELKSKQPPHHCIRLVLPWIEDDIPHTVKCAECKCPMKRTNLVLFTCCTEKEKIQIQI